MYILRKAPQINRNKLYMLSADLTRSTYQSPLALLRSHISYSHSHNLTIAYSHILYYSHLKEFGLQTIRHLCPCVRSSLAVPVVLLSGQPSLLAAQTLRFSRFIACPPAPFESKAFWIQNHAVAMVWRTCTLQTSFFYRLDRPLAYPTQKVCTIITFRLHISETTIKTYQKFELCTPTDHFELLAAVL